MRIGGGWKGEAGGNAGGDQAEGPEGMKGADLRRHQLPVGHRGPLLLPLRSGIRFKNGRLPLPGATAGTGAGEGSNDEAVMASVLTNLGAPPTNGQMKRARNDEISSDPRGSRQ